MTFRAAATPASVAYYAVEDCPAMSFVFVCWHIQLKIKMQIRWVGRSTRWHDSCRLRIVSRSSLFVVDGIHIANIVGQNEPGIWNIWNIYDLAWELCEYIWPSRENIWPKIHVCEYFWPTRELDRYIWPKIELWAYIWPTREKIRTQ